MQVPVNDFIDSVLLNNPEAVSYNLALQGVLQENEVLQPDALKRLLYREYFTRSDGNTFLSDTLNVPLDPYGEQAQELLTMYNEGASPEALQQAMQVSPPVEGSSLKLPAFNLKKAMNWLGFAALILANLYLIKKIFFNHGS